MPLGTWPAVSRARVCGSAPLEEPRGARRLHDHTRVVSVRIEAGIFGWGGMSVRSRAGGVKGKFCVVDKGGRGSPSCAPRSSPAASFSASIVKDFSRIRCGRKQGRSDHNWPSRWSTPSLTVTHRQAGRSKAAVLSRQLLVVAALSSSSSIVRANF